MPDLTENGTRCFHPDTLQFSFEDEDAVDQGLQACLSEKTFWKPQPAPNPYPEVTLYMTTMAREDEYLAKLAGRQDVTTGSEVRLDIAQIWLRRCRKDHTMCNGWARGRLRLHALPIRVVEIGLPHEHRDPRLYVTKGETDEHVCLSHRWGGGKLTMTTLETLAAHVHHMRLGDMPKTFQDAIHVAKSLVFR